MDDPALADLLAQFGLSEKQIDTYLVLLEHGEAKASVVAEDAGVSKRYVYSISEKLEERGFVSVNDHVVPTTIRANPPEEVIETLTQNVERMRPALEARYSRAPQPSEEFEVIKSRVTVLKRVAELIADAEGEVVLSLPYAQLSEVEEELRAVVDRGVLVLLVVTGVDPEASGVAAELTGLGSAVRVWREPMPTMITADRTRSAVAPPEMIARSNSGRQAISFMQAQLAPVMIGSFFGNYWPTAEQVTVADPRSLPATYEDFRHAVFQSTLHLRAGTDLVATVQGTAVGEGEDGTELTGRVVETRQGLVTPVNNAFPVENALVVEAESGLHTVGGKGAFVEDFEADEVALYPAGGEDESTATDVEAAGTD
jgi:sugar-specific transcriptional regulator TrmB/ribosomal protein S19